MTKNTMNWLRTCLSTRNLSCGLLLLFGSHAGATTIATIPAPTVSIPGLTEFETTGADMDGLTVTATFDGGFTETLFWADTGLGAGGVTGVTAGNMWGLSLTGDSFEESWSFTNETGSALLELILDGSTGFTVFDRTDPFIGTPGSARGLDFAEAPTTDGTATYSQQVQIGANPPVGDIWHVLSIVFDNGINDDWVFFQDTDNDSNIPEPATLALLGLGLAGLRFTNRLKNH